MEIVHSMLHIVVEFSNDLHALMYSGHLLKSSQIVYVFMYLGGDRRRSSDLCISFTVRNLKTEF